MYCPPPPPPVSAYEPEEKMALSLGILPVVMAELLNKVQQVHQQSSQLTDELLLMLKFVFGPPILQALELVDQRSVTFVDSPSGRSLYQVIGSSGRVYRCFSSCLYCSCAAFMYSVLRRNDHILCKHLLAVYLCQAMGTLRQLRVSNQQLTDLLQAKDEELESTE
ncbi:zinc finger SWIM domain-containing protein 7 isoform X2 [Amblyraja radiata]|uniref:zinc finger SWIM domain-containing protein 7 isoform X2 n=1 Tax=Amblyraja radiata TaxID=386614 RepID=UPI0014030A49|nr:zinc finger SWIM domain-containing protein 7 isoform X2 [Amblyraja radiata]